MSDIFLFDVDGTLTFAKQKIDKTFQKDLLKWMDNKEVYIVSGGTFERILKLFYFHISKFFKNRISPQRDDPCAIF